MSYDHSFTAFTGVTEGVTDLCPVDAADLIARFGLDGHHEVKEVLESFVPAATTLVGDIFGACQVGDFPAARRQAHALVGAGRNASAYRLADAAYRIEHLEPGSEAEFKTLSFDLVRTLGEINAYMDTH